MISFRFHIVSLTAIFVALALGIGIGAGVVDRKTVVFLEGRLRTVENRASATNAENDRLRSDVASWQRFADQGATSLVRGKLDAPVIVVGVQGIDRKPVDALRQTLVAAGARLQGTVWFTSKLKLANPDDVRTLQSILGVASARPEVLRRSLATRLAEGWLPGGPGTVLPALKDAGFLDFEPPSGTPVDLAATPPAGSLTVVVSGSQAALPNGEVALPFVTTLAHASPNRVLVAESGHPATADKPAERAVFLRTVLNDAPVAATVSTVDNLEDVRGRIAAVLALGALVEGRAGHYGVGPGAERAVPDVGPTP
jgi:hypothetical protein